MLSRSPAHSTGRHTFATTGAKRNQQKSGEDAGGKDHPRGWDTRVVLAIAAGAGMTGWTLSSGKQERPLSASFLPKGLSGITGGDDKPPRYGSMVEMEMVRIAVARFKS